MKEEIDYSEKINYFKELTNIRDDEIALKYLLTNKWDMEKATKNYFDDIVVDDERNSTSLNYPNAQEEIPNESRGVFGSMLNSINKMMNFSNPLLENFFPTQNESISNTNILQNFEHVSPRIVPKSTPKNELLKFLPFHANSLTEFNKNIKNKIGILFLYKEKDLDTLNHLIECLFLDSDMLHILETQFVTYSAVDESQEGQTILKNNRYKTPCCLFMYNPRNLSENNSSIIFDKLEEHFHEDSLITGIYNSISNKDIIEKGNYVNNNQPLHSDYQFDYDDQDDSHSNLIRKQNEELRQLEQEEENKRRRIKFEEDLRKQKEKEERELLEKKQHDQQKSRDFKLFKAKQLHVEPSADDKNSTHILFRFPDGIHRVERRFNKKDTIGDMYNVIESLDDAGFNHEGKFELIQTFPFALFNDKEKTLEEEKLFPNAVIQIREKEYNHQ